MAKNRVDYLTEIERRIKDGAKILSPADYKAMIDTALEIYSRIKPGDIVIELTSDGSGDFAVSALTGYDEENGGDPAIEYPVVTSGEPEYLDRRAWQFHRTLDGLVVRVFSSIPNGQKVRFHFKGNHSITESSSTIPASDFYAFCKLAAAEGCGDLSLHYTQTSERPQMGVDQAFFTSKAKEYENRGKRLKGEASTHFGIGDEDGPPAASATKNWDTTNSRGGDRLTHPRRNR